MTERSSLPFQIRVVAPGAKPNWYVTAPERAWINMTTAVGAMRWNDPAIDAENYLSLGSSQNDHHAAISKWCGAIAREDFYVLALGGGHNGGSGNVIYEFGPFSSENPTWHSWGTDPAKYQKPSDALDWQTQWADGGEWCIDNIGGVPLAEQGYYSDGLPVSRHSYSQACFIPQLSGGFGRQGFWPLATGVWCSTGNSGTVKAASITFRSNTDVGADYDAKDTWPDAIGTNRGGGAIFDPVTEKVFVLHFGSGASGSVVEYDPRTRIRNTLSSGAGGMGGTGILALDTERRIIVLHHIPTSGGHRMIVADVDHDGRVGGSYGAVTEVSYDAGPMNKSAVSAVYHPPSDAFIGYRGGVELHKMVAPADYRSGGASGAINPVAHWTWTTLANGPGGASPSTDTDEGGLQSRFRYISSLDCFAVIVNSAGARVTGTPDDNMYVYKIPTGGL